MKFREGEVMNIRFKEHSPGKWGEWISAVKSVLRKEEVCLKRIIVVWRSALQRSVYKNKNNASKHICLPIIVLLNITTNLRLKKVNKKPSNPKYNNKHYNNTRDKYQDIEKVKSRTFAFNNIHQTRIKKARQSWHVS